MNSKLLSLMQVTAITTLTVVSFSIHETDFNAEAKHLKNSLVSISPVAAKSILWKSELSLPNWRDHWKVQNKGSWGLKNVQVIPDPTSKFSKILRVRYPAGSASPTVSRNEQAPIGGAQFYANLGIEPQKALHLSYYIRFPKNFDFVKGGKLPGLFGGNGNSGGNIPDGSDGFSTRFMWRQNGAGEVYAYLPTSQKHGTSIGRGMWQFQRGFWHHIEQEVVLNQPGQSDGNVKVWLDGVLVLDKGSLTFRTVDTLQIEGIFFSTFFGGDDTSWATPNAVYVDFANFSVSSASR